MQQLRAYQEEARAAVHEQLEEHRSTLVVAATGTGKTIMFAAVARDIVDQGGRVLVLAHRSELVHQAVGKLETICGCDVGIEMAASTAAADLDGPLFGGGLKVVCATVQSMSRRLDRYSPEAFDLIVVDEAHHIVAGTYAKIIDHFAGAKVLGVTATPDRGDKKALRKAIESVAYVFDIREAISDGWLVPIKQRVVDVENLDLSEIRTVAGDFHRGQLDEALCDLACLHEMAGPIAEEVGDRQTIVFTASVAHAHAMAKVLSEYTDRTVEALDGTSDPAVRADVLRRYADGDVHFLLNCALFTEGFDAPATSAIAVCRPTKSRALYAQCLDAETEILTDAGWKGIDDDLAGLRVAAFVPETGGQVWSMATRMERRLGDEAMWGIDSPGLDLRVTAGHRMLLSQRKARDHVRTPWGFVRAELVPGEFEVPICADGGQGEADLTDHEVTFLGLLLTDGHRNKHNNAITFSQSEKNPEVIALIENTLDKCGFKFGRPSLTTAPSNFGPRSPLHRWTVSKGKPRGRDRHLQGWGRLERWVSDDSKSLTPAYEELSARQVSVLVNAMNAGNGAKAETDAWARGTLSICVANRALADQLQGLLVRRGHRCNQRPMEVASMLHVSTRARKSVKRSSSDTRPTWGPVPSRADERVWCVEVDTGAIFVRRNGKVAVVGNCIGRGTRPLPGVVDGVADRKGSIAGSAKPDVLVLDFAGNAGRHTLVTAADVLGGDLSDEVIKEAKGLVAAGDYDDVLAALDAATKIIDAKRLEEMRDRARRGYKTRGVDPFDVFGVVADPDPYGREATRRQLEYLERKGITTSVDYQQAKKLIDACESRRKQRLATFKQATLLLKKGLDPALVWQVSFERASKMIDALAQNRWKPPHGWEALAKEEARA